MKARLIDIGNSKGVRIPKTIIEQCGLSGSIEMDVVEGRLVIKSNLPDRHDWVERFKKAGTETNENLTGDFSNNWDESEWQW